MASVIAVYLLVSTGLGLVSGAAAAESRLVSWTFMIGDSSASVTLTLGANVEASDSKVPPGTRSTSVGFSASSATATLAVSLDLPIVGRVTGSVDFQTPIGEISIPVAEITVVTVNVDVVGALVADLSPSRNGVSVSTLQYTTYGRQQASVDLSGLGHGQEVAVAAVYSYAILVGVSVDIPIIGKVRVIPPQTVAKSAPSQAVTAHARVSDPLLEALPFVGAAVAVVGVLAALGLVAVRRGRASRAAQAGEEAGSHASPPIFAAPSMAEPDSGPLPEAPAPPPLSPAEACFPPVPLLQSPPTYIGPVAPQCPNCWQYTHLEPYYGRWYCPRCSMYPWG